MTDTLLALRFSGKGGTSIFTGQPLLICFLWRFYTKNPKIQKISQKTEILQISQLSSHKHHHITHQIMSSNSKCMFHYPCLMYNEQELRVDDVLCQEKWKEGIEHRLGKGFKRGDGQIIACYLLISNKT